MMQTHLFYMQRALDLADRAKGTTFPNPSVGAIVVKKGTIVGEGATHKAGGPHAEKSALDIAGSKAQGATLYVTLEPCSHHGRTPPCVDAIIDAGIIEVYASVKDPNPLVSGAGIRKLRRAGIMVHVGLLKEASARLNEDFFFAIVHKRPWITLKLALTLDGKIADSRGQSTWITSAESRALVHDLRRRHAGIAIGRKTLIADDPLLTVRHVPGVSPVRFVFSSSETIPAGSKLATTANEIQTAIVVNQGVESCIIKEPGSYEIWHTGRKNRLQSFHSFACMAYEQGITSVLVEGGATLASFLLENKLVNRLSLFYGNRILGSGKAGVHFSKSLALSDALTLKEMEIVPLGDNVMVTGLL